MSKEIVNQILQQKNIILDALKDIEQILLSSKHTQKEYYLAKSHYIPQIITVKGRH